MSLLFLLRLLLDFVAVGLLLVALAYNLFDNLAHEIMGTMMFLLLGAHNVFNRRWYGTVAERRGGARGIVTRSINLSLLTTMLALLFTSVLISQSVFSFLNLNSTFTARQIHTLVAYLALLIAAVHLGLHWSLIMGVVRSKLGLSATSKLRTFMLRGLSAAIAAYGIYSLFVLNIGSKLLMQVTMDFWDFQTSTAAFFFHHIAIIGLCASVFHYGTKGAQDRRSVKTR